jgi:hypothetical protein
MSKAIEWQRALAGCSPFDTLQRQHRPFSILGSPLRHILLSNALSSVACMMLFDPTL